MIGQVIGNYKITEKIGEGGMGSVFKGLDFMLEREVAIKMLRPELAQQPQIVERFRLEAITLAKLSHPNIATLHAFLRQGNDFFMVMEFVSGNTLSSLINQIGPLPCDQAVNLLCQALEGIEHAHEFGIIHRDIKPENIMLTQKGLIKVMDFGIARVLGMGRMTRHGHLVGTIEYMSPEQVRGEEADVRSDIYSTGVLLYEIVTGQLPFSSDSDYELMKMQVEQYPPLPRGFDPSIPEFVEKAILRALTKDPELRFQSASQFRYALSGGERLSILNTYMLPHSMAATSTPIASSSNAAPAPERKVEKLEFAGNEVDSPATVNDEIKPTRLAQDIKLQPASKQAIAHSIQEEFQVSQNHAYDLPPLHIKPDNLLLSTPPSQAGKRSWLFKVAIAAALGGIVIVFYYALTRSGYSPGSNAPSTVSQPVQPLAGSSTLKAEPEKQTDAQSTTTKVLRFNANGQLESGHDSVDSSVSENNTSESNRPGKSRRQNDAASARARRAKEVRAEQEEMKRIRARIKQVVQKNQ